MVRAALIVEPIASNEVFIRIMIVRRGLPAEPSLLSVPLAETWISAAEAAGLINARKASIFKGCMVRVMMSLVMEPDQLVNARLAIHMHRPIPRRLLDGLAGFAKNRI